MLERVGVVGGGIMGTGISEVCAREGLDVVLVEVDSEAESRGAGFGPGIAGSSGDPWKA